MTKSFSRKIISSQAGSSMILALTSVALMGLMASATMTVAGILSNEAAKKSQFDLVSNMSQALETTITNRFACRGTSTQGQGNSGNPMLGLRFSTSTSGGSSGGSTEGNGRGGNGGTGGNGNGNGQNRTYSKTCGATCLQRGVGAAGKLHVSLDSSLGDINGAFNNGSVAVTELYLRNVTSSGTSTSRSASGELMASIRSINPAINFAPRLISEVNLVFTNDVITDCNAAPSAQMMCEQMDCVYNVNAPSGAQRCTCGFPNLSCPSGKFIAGYDPATRSAVCADVGLNCATSHGPGYFFAGIDAAGNAVCLAAEGGYAQAAQAPPPAQSGTLCWSRDMPIAAGKTPIQDPSMHCTTSGACATQGAIMNNAKCMEYDATAGETANDATLGAGYDIYCVSVASLSDPECTVPVNAPSSTSCSVCSNTAPTRSTSFRPSNPIDCEPANTEQGPAMCRYGSSYKGFCGDCP